MSTRLVSEFALPADPVDASLDYPFRQPGQSYFTDGESVRLVSDEYAAFYETTNALLKSRALATLDERIPVVAYGANASPDRLREKMSAYGPAELQPAMQTMPNIVAEIENAAIVWHGKPGQTGSIFAELYRDSETVDMQARCFVQFMDEKQLALLHATEGVTYHLVDVPVRVGSDRQSIIAKAYVAGRSEILVVDGQPAPVQRPGRERLGNALTAREAVQFILKNASVEAGTKSVSEYVEQGLAMKLAERKERQQRVCAKLASLGLSKLFTFPGATENYYGRADFTDLHGPHPEVYWLAEQSLQELRPFGDNGQIDPAAKDIMKRIRARATSELEQRTAAARA